MRKRFRVTKDYCAQLSSDDFDWAVYDSGEGKVYEPDPIAVFRSRRDAREFAARKEAGK